jgi:DHA1 family bicyclomycin/chloramphenicol resistance-like MFS transporter
MMGILTLLPSDIYIPAMPLMQADFNTTTSHVQLTMSFFFLGAGISQILAGPVIDGFNNKKISLISLCIFFIASITCIFAPSLDILIFCRFLQAFSAGFAVVISRAAVIKTCSREDATRIFLIMSPIIAVSPGVAPIIGGYLAKFFGWKASFIL